MKKLCNINKNIQNENKKIYRIHLVNIFFPKYFKNYNVL